ncbi:hypothetical protein [Candidatus Amarolinea dominans]
MAEVSADRLPRRRRRVKLADGTGAWRSLFRPPDELAMTFKGQAIPA